jgi:hypothetical protein
MNIQNNMPNGYSDHELGLDRAQEALYEQAREMVLEELNGKYVSEYEMDDLMCEALISLSGHDEDEY